VPIIRFCFALLLLATPALAQPTGYTAPAEFMDLFFDFTGSNEPGYPSGQPTLGQVLTQSVIARDAARGAPGPLVMVVGSSIYVYDSVGGTRLAQEQFRADRASGFWNGLFGWGLSESAMPEMDYRMAQISEDQGVAVFPSDEPGTGPTVYFETDDIDASIAKTRSLGGDAGEKSPVPEARSSTSASSGSFALSTPSRFHRKSIPYEKVAVTKS